jgi:hypothetical protein
MFIQSIGELFDMAWKINNFRYSSGIFLLSGLSSVACKFSGGASPQLGNDSIVAAVGGISDEDINLNLNYRLLCKDSGGQTSRKPVDGQVDNKTKILFKNAGEIKAADKCAFEARLGETKLKEPPFKDYQWYASTGANKEIGLMYASQLGTVSADRKLTLDVFKVYDPPKDPNGFQVLVKVSLPEDKDVTIANLKGCTKKDGGNLDNAVGEVGGNGGTATSRTLSFNLSKDFIDGKCTAVSVLDNGNKQSYSIANVSTIVFTGVKAKDTVTLPKDGSELKLAKDSTSAGSSPSNNGNGIDIQANDKGECRVFDVNTRSCKDNANSAPQANLTTVAKSASPTIVQLEVTKGSEKQILFMSGKDGISGLSSDVTIDALGKGTINTGTNSFFKPSSTSFNPNVILDKPLSKDNASGSLLGEKVSDLKDYKFVKITGAWSQKFIETSKVNIDRFANPVWFARLNVTKSGTTESMIIMRPGFVATIKDKLTPPGKSSTDRTYFSWEAIIKAEGKDFNVYSMKKCGRKIDDVERTMSKDWGSKTIEDLNNATNRSLKDCMIPSGDDLIKGGWQLTGAKFYQLLWISTN